MTKTEELLEEAKACADACRRKSPDGDNDWPASVISRLVAALAQQDKEAATGKTADDEDFPEEPLSPEFRERLTRTVNNALAFRRYVLNLAGAATGHRVEWLTKKCRECQEVWPCKEVLRAAAPIFEYEPTASAASSRLADALAVLGQDQAAKEEGWEYGVRFAGIRGSARGDYALGSEGWARRWISEYHAPQLATLIRRRITKPGPWLPVASASPVPEEGEQ